ncbi:hypothetical protein CC85DRAFT_287778 [Cutaneotrichosporon oleaginosum]|uniref:Uncharacterized protein n=1 Tax=Cutaneotrichosporon oleaginosum TaxID=879819 RepID=A0A0J0XGG3_9TREE|nr:uncharacterized protein CC85DRAFT_287778 [Cutaneotrichosporon oleaginosum]KLT40153.1 hypothetical protein CC85DRAFT_287778 [Cutaneotrichosporon oleaginosum]TXT06882.1 hypothetical protein COLE_06213 [Cutaneotrichosporon oleaginosum]
MPSSPQAVASAVCLRSCSSGIQQASHASVHPIPPGILGMQSAISRPWVWDLGAYESGGWRSTPTEHPQAPEAPGHSAPSTSQPLRAQL